MNNMDMRKQSGYGDMLDQNLMDYSNNMPQKHNYDSEFNTMINNNNFLTQENFNNALDYQNNNNSNANNNRQYQQSQQQLNQSQSQQQGMDNNQDYQNSNIPNGNNQQNNNLNNGETINQYQSDLEIQNKEQQQKIDKVGQFLNYLSMEGNKYIKQKSQQQKQNLIDFLVDSQDLIEQTLIEGKENVKTIGVNRKANLKNTIQYAFNIQNSFFPQTWPKHFQTSYLFIFNSLPGRKCPLPTIKTSGNVKLDLEGQNVFKITTDLIQIDPAPNTQVYCTTSQNTEKQFPIPYFDFVDNKSLLINLKQFKPQTQTTIQLVVAKQLCEESDLYTITICPEGGENGIARPEFNVDGSHRREESWKHTYAFDNVPQENQNPIEINQDLAAYFDED